MAARNRAPLRSLQHGEHRWPSSLLALWRRRQVNHENDAAMVRACARTIARIVDSRRCFGNAVIHDLGIRTMRMAERLADNIEVDDAREQREFAGEDTTQAITEVGVVPVRR